ncbi:MULTISPECIES: SMP-30/gluconolactonase/LRE family protein [Metallosphaera]|uniref:SMP-30/Gluconolaconase/LRE domain protein n=3 Tax=Metallosphaera TaxID=41980 RepID=A4YG99_METS5|nr:MULTISPECIES: SMP-30/gluconolactonase/LRE family protein [Metallosphaera]ABP95451.1 SMP-30/Gluconolaconase/LRE domain protein [Metallosphaera sedula DSM 5348]AIM27436.1 SMP-30/Gluconolaconase/LRE domain protein [Metallosphaera sedula]AKV74309.1 gluconolaconase [Metallosphaera sedula]AKV76548.1 gluconolaconase [Metallosphaera sedula]AKV78800.1 gluconolaconase [Metallosphaera sedula]
MEPSIYVRSNARLGEGPLWDPRTGTLYWVDIEGGKLHVTRDGKDTVIDAPQMISSLGLTHEPGTLITSAGLTLYKFSGEFTPISSITAEGVRFNDGKCGPKGEFWVGTMDLKEERDLGILYRFNGEFTPLVDHLIISNGMDWFKNVYYLVDSPRKRVYAFRVRDDELESLGAAVDTSDYPGVPDGMTMDSSGLIWVAHYGGGLVTVWEPFSRRPVLEIQMPVKIVTSVVFGGPELNQLFVTSSSRAGEELGGSVFVVETEYRGREPFVCMDFSR